MKEFVSFSFVVRKRGLHPRLWSVRLSAFLLAKNQTEIM